MERLPGGNSLITRIDYILNNNNIKYSISVEWQLILLFAAAKLLVHFFTYSNYELHRDAYLYYALGQHLAWGYVAVPPFVAVVGKFATWLFGNTVFALRFFPGVIGAVNIIIIGMAVKELGGKKIAIILASMAYLLSPSYLHTNALFQPVAFNHFFWLLSSYFILLMIHRNDPHYWIAIAICFGLAFLNKYSIVFFMTAFVLSLLLTPYRKLYRSKYFGYALLIGMVIVLPNLMWQYNHNWPVMKHMAELRETQLVHVRLSDFIISQFMMNAQAVLLWVGALMVLLFYGNEKQFRLFGFLIIIVVVLLMLSSGKSYYTLGVYPILFVFGAYFFEKYIPKYRAVFVLFLVGSMFAVLYISLSFDGIPFRTFKQVEKKDGYRWEDGVNHDVPQDMADMTGWKAIGEGVCDIWLGLGERRKDSCDIYCYHYGQAGAVMFYGKKDKVPQPISFNGSFLFWAPDKLIKKYMIWVHSDLNNYVKPDSLLPQLFEKVELKASVKDKWFRENPTRIYLCETPKDNFKSYYQARIETLKEEYGEQH